MEMGEVSGVKRERSHVTSGKTRSNRRKDEHKENKMDRKRGGKTSGRRARGGETAEKRLREGQKEMKGIHSEVRKQKKKKGIELKKQSRRASEIDRGRERESDRERERERERVDSCRASRWLSSGTQRQTPFSNPIVSAGRHPAPLCNPVNMHPIPSRKHTHGVQATHALELEPHMELLPHTRVTGKKHHVGTRSQNTHTHTRVRARAGKHSRNTPRPDKCFLSC